MLHCKHAVTVLFAFLQFSMKKCVITEETCTQKLQTFHKTKRFLGSPLKHCSLQYTNSRKQRRSWTSQSSLSVNLNACNTSVDFNTSNISNTSSYFNTSRDFNTSSEFSDCTSLNTTFRSSDLNASSVSDTSLNASVSLLTKEDLHFVPRPMSLRNLSGYESKVRNQNINFSASVKDSENYRIAMPMLYWYSLANPYALELDNDYLGESCTEILLQTLNVTKITVEKMIEIEEKTCDHSHILNIHLLHYSG